MVDRPDFSPSRGVDIVAATIGSLPIDIASESIGQLAVDIASQSVGDLDININGQTGTLSVNLDGSNVTLDVNIDSQTGTLDTSVSSSTATFDTNITGQDVDLSTVINGSNTVLNTNIDSQTTDLDTTITGQTSTLSTAIDAQNVTLDTNISSQTGDVGIDIQSQTIGDLGIDIASQSLTEVGTRTDQEPAETVNFVQITRNTTVDDVGSGDDVFIQPPADEVWELQALRLDANPVPGSSTGDHGFNVFALDGQISLVKGTSTFNQEVTWRQHYWQEADQEQKPPDVAAQGQAIRGVRIDQTTPLVVTYLNRTDSSTSETRVIRALFRAIKVA